MAEDLRARVIACLQAAGFAHREEQLPTQHSGGTFSAYGSDRSGVNVTAAWWDVPPGELEGSRVRIVRALKAAGFAARRYPDRIYVPPPEDE